MASWWKRIAQQLGETALSGSWQKRVASHFSAINLSGRSWPQRIAGSVGAQRTSGSWEKRLTQLGATARSWPRALYETDGLSIGPTLSSPTDTQTGATTADLSVSTTGDDGALYWVVTTSSTAPSAAQVKAGQDHTGAAASDSGSQAVSATGVQNANATGLTAETAYFAHFMHEDAGTNQSNVASGDGFTTGAATDPNFASVVLLVGFDGADGSTTFTDESNSAHTLTPVGDAQIDTAQSKFGGSSLRLDGTGDRVNLAASADWNVGANPFTIEVFVRVSAFQDSNNRGILTTTGGAGLNAYVLQVSTTEFSFQFNHSGGIGYDKTLTTLGVLTPTTDTWYHVCAERGSGNKFRLYIDGVMRASLTSSVTVNYENTSLVIGTVNATGNPLNGWLDEIRITKGVARYDSDAGFTVPASAYPRS